MKEPLNLMLRMELTIGAMFHHQFGPEGSSPLLNRLWPLGLVGISRLVRNQE